MLDRFMFGREHHNLQLPSVIGKVRTAALLVLSKEALIGLPTDPMQDDTLCRLRRARRARSRKGSFRVCLHILSSSLSRQDFPCEFIWIYDEIAWTARYPQVPP